MNLIRNLLALLGLFFLIVVAVALYQVKDRFSGFDEGASQVYLNMFSKILDSKNPAEATVWKVPVQDGLDIEDVEDAMRAVATEMNIANVGEMPLSLDIEAKTGKPYRYVKIFQFCRSRTAAVMMDYSDAYAAYMPCRVAVLEDKQGKFWLISMDMDMMIYGGATLPEDLKQKALQVKHTIQEIMRRGAAGEF